MLRFLSFAAAFIGLLTAFSASDGASAQDRRVPSSAAELRLSFAPIVQRVQPAVVNVYAAKTVQNRNPLLDDPIFRRFFGVPGQQPEQMQRSLGSGVMVDASGLVVTNNHVIEGADQVKISLADKREFEAEIVLKDSRTDLAVLRVKDGKEKFATLDFANSDELLVRVVVASAKGGGKAVKRPWLGARLQAVTPEIAETLGLRLPSGALVANVTANGPAAKAGLKLSDLIVGIDGQIIDDPNAFDYRF